MDYPFAVIPVSVPGSRPSRELYLGKQVSKEWIWRCRIEAGFGGLDPLET